TLSAHDITITGELNAPGSVQIVAAGDVRNQGAVIIGKTLAITANGLIDNQAGKLIWAGEDLFLLAGTQLLNGVNSQLLAQGDMSLSAGRKLQNNVGRIEAQKNLWIDTPLLENLSQSSGGVANKGVDKEDVWHTKADGLIERDYWNIKIEVPIYTSNLTVEQAVIKAGGDLLLNQDEAKGSGARVHNLGGLMAATGNVLVDGHLDNQGMAATKTLIDILKASPAEYYWSNSRALSPSGRKYYPQGLYGLLDDFFSPSGGSANWVDALKLVNKAGANQLLSAVLGADWKALSHAQLRTRWSDFKANGTKRTQNYYAATQAEISAGKAFLHEGGTFTNGDGSNWGAQRSITAQVGSETV
ncbi:hypothetical protein, partial [Pseudomonas turukhanskensis]|uniref:hypothetical protein n=1 Tax=Pseudomonas turukhanskensis TaxID=1806536 RepID=UPI0022F34335